jgi:hypothetical protein
VREETGQRERQEEPLRPPTSPDYSWVEKIIKEKVKKKDLKVFLIFF